MVLQHLRLSILWSLIPWSVFSFLQLFDLVAFKPPSALSLQFQIASFVNFDSNARDFLCMSFAILSLFSYYLDIEYHLVFQNVWMFYWVVVSMTPHLATWTGAQTQTYAFSGINSNFDVSNHPLGLGLSSQVASLLDHLRSFRFYGWSLSGCSSSLQSWPIITRACCFFLIRSQFFVSHLPWQSSDLKCSNYAREAAHRLPAIWLLATYQCSTLGYWAKADQNPR